NHRNIFDFSQKYGKQMIWIVAALVLAMITLLIDGKFFSQFAYPIYGICLLMLIAVIFAGREIQGSRSWFQVGGIALQPAEFAKMATALAVSKYLTTVDVDLRKAKTYFLASLLILLPGVLVLLEHDTGSALVFISFVFLLYRAGMPGLVLVAIFAFPVLGVLALLFNKFIIAGAILGAGILWFLYTRRRIRDLLRVLAVVAVAVGFVFSVNFVFNHILEPHQKTRIEVLLGKDTDVKGAGYNVNQSLIAIGSGGWIGKGFLHGTQTKFNFVPEQSTDFIFCTVGEEYGFLGSTVLIALYMILLLRILFVAERQRSRFSRLYGYGVASVIFFHFAINIGMTLGLIPVIGIPLPFFSYGGSALWAFTLLLFIFIRQDAYRYELL
ncbi:MAG TPA: rod shape-determining protein RodA, partial [Bacteroidales bacterium]|nr:rod shape-determining protein RodA [Bacteroidales bacterium]